MPVGANRRDDEKESWIVADGRLGREGLRENLIVVQERNRAADRPPMPQCPLCHAFVAPLEPGGSVDCRQCRVLIKDGASGRLRLAWVDDVETHARS